MQLPLCFSLSLSLAIQLFVPLSTTVVVHTTVVEVFTFDSYDGEEEIWGEKKTFLWSSSLLPFLSKKS